jgi:dTDP-4-amino-4,6-dideoxygalactose transaminase
MDFIDLKTQQQRIKSQLDANIQKVLAHGNYIMGPEVKELEKKLAAYTGAKHAISCASGTDALLMALMAYGVKPGDAIFTTPFTFIATAEVISLLGATPVFVDIDPKTFNIDPAKLALAIKALQANDPSIYPLPNIEHRTLNIEQSSPVEPRTLNLEHRTLNTPLTPKGVIPVDLFGLLANYDAIDKIAKENNMFVIEDAAQSFGANYKGKMSCSYGDISCTSFFPAKPLGCYGDGGMCFTNDDKLAEIMESIRVHGKGGHKYDNVRIGINGRLDTLQAAILLAKFDIFPEEVELRNQVAQRFTDLLASSNIEHRTLNLEQSSSVEPRTLNIEPLTPPHIPAGNTSAWAQYSLLAGNEDHRTSLLKKLQDNKIPSAIYYPKPLHMQTAFASLGYKPGAFPVSKDIAGRIFSLPMHPYLEVKNQEKIAQVLTAQA